MVRLSDEKCYSGSLSLGSWFTTEKARKRLGNLFGGETAETYMKEEEINAQQIWKEKKEIYASLSGMKDNFNFGSDKS